MLNNLIEAFELNDYDSFKKKKTKKQNIYIAATWAQVFLKRFDMCNIQQKIVNIFCTKNKYNYFTFLQLRSAFIVTICRNIVGL